MNFIAGFEKIFFILVLMASSTSWAKDSKRIQLSMEARSSIYQFFKLSDRDVQSIEVEYIKSFSESFVDYLVEANVVAQSPFAQDLIDYRCGVFIKKIGSKWFSQQTVCEALKDNSS